MWAAKRFTMAIESLMCGHFRIPLRVLFLSQCHRGSLKKMIKTEILTRLKNYKERKQLLYNFLRIGVFGSVARNSNSENSDIDILIEQRVPDLFTLGTIKTALEEEFGTKIDIIRLHDGLNDSFKKRIEKESIYV
jgi:uncharacterized protein